MRPEAVTDLTLPQLARVLGITPAEGGPDSRYLGPLINRPYSHEAQLAALRELLSKTPSSPELTLFARVSGLDYARRYPYSASVLVGNPWASASTFALALSGHSLVLARLLYDRARELLNEGSTDAGIAYFRKARSEWQFLLPGCEFLRDGLLSEALGKIAVATAAIGRWSDVDPEAIDGAIEYLDYSIRAGNTGTEAIRYLSELHEQRFHATGSIDAIQEAISLANRAQDELSAARCTLLANLREDGSGQRDKLFSSIQRLRRATALTATDYVQRDVLVRIATAHLLGEVSLKNLELSLPFGLAHSLRRIPRSDAEAVAALVAAELDELQERCQRRIGKRNIIAQQLAVALREFLFYSEPTVHRADSLHREASSLAMLIPNDRHAAWRRHAAEGETALYRAQYQSVEQTVERLEALSSDHDGWAAPLATAADLLQRAAAQSNLEHLHAASRSMWRRLSTQVQSGTIYRRQYLGGRAGVFVLEDVRRDLQSAFVFKPVRTPAQGRHEMHRLNELRDLLNSRDLRKDMSAAEPLAVVDGDGHDAILILRRALGRPLGDLPRHLQAQHLGRVVQLLSYCTPTEGVPAGATGWQTVKNTISPGLRAMAPSRRSDLLAAIREALPDRCPVVVRRDGNPNNWLIDAAGRVVAVDLEARAPAPAGFDLAQTIEDRAMLQATPPGFAERYQRMEEYFEQIGVAEAVTAEVSKRTYDWCALNRAIWIHSYPASRRSDVQHSRNLLQHLAEHAVDPSVRPIAAELASYSSGYGENPASQSPVNTHLSRRIAMLLRHSREMATNMDAAGWATIPQVAESLGVDEESVRLVGTHPDERRFQVLGDRIRARYGHTVPIVYDAPPRPVPKVLYHGTTWAALDRIMAEGLLPMGRILVHLATDEDEALEVARRHGPPLLLRVNPANVVGLVNVAPAIWGAERVPPSALSMVSGSGDVFRPIRDVVPTVR